MNLLLLVIKLCNASIIMQASKPSQDGYTVVAHCDRWTVSHTIRLGSPTTPTKTGNSDSHWRAPYAWRTLLAVATLP